MTTTFSLKKAFTQKQLPKFFKINLQIQKMINENKFVVTDGGVFSEEEPTTLVFCMEIVGNFKQNQRKYFAVGAFIKLIRPTLRMEDYTILVNEKTIVCLGDQIEGLPAPAEFLPLDATLVMDSNTPVPGKVLAKVVRIYDQKGPYSTRYGPKIKYACQIKDLDGIGQVLQFWRPESKLCPVQPDMTYVFYNLKTDKVTDKYFSEKPYQLSCDKDIDIEEASREQNEEHSNIRYSDGMFRGAILAINNVSKFRSCFNCSRSINVRNFVVGEKCPNCKKEVAIINEDFSFTLIVEGEDDVLSMTCFKRLITYDGSCNDEKSIELELFKILEGKMVEGEYLKKRFADQVTLNVYTLTFL